MFQVFAFMLVIALACTAHAQTGKPGGLPGVHPAPSMPRMEPMPRPLPEIQSVPQAGGGSPPGVIVDPQPRAVPPQCSCYDRNGNYSGSSSGCC